MKNILVVEDEPIVDNFSERARLLIASMQAPCQQLLSAKGTGRNALLEQVIRKLRVLTGTAARAPHAKLAGLSSLLEGLLKKISEERATVSPKTVRTVTDTLDFLRVLAERDSPWPAAAPAEPRILVVDDDALMCAIVAAGLELAGLRPAVVENAPQALKLQEVEPFDLILLDVRMPGVSGFELCERIRRLPAHHHTPVIFMTGLSDADSHGRSILSGGTDVIVKPFLLSELAVKAMTHILKSQLRTEK